MKPRPPKLAALPTWTLVGLRFITAAGSWCFWGLAAIHSAAETELARRRGL